MAETARDRAGEYLAAALAHDPSEDAAAILRLRREFLGRAPARVGGEPSIRVGTGEPEEEEQEEEEEEEEEDGATEREKEAQRKAVRWSTEGRRKLAEVRQKEAREKAKETAKSSNVAWIIGALILFRLLAALAGDRK